jgi:hypothetical protein
MSGFAWIYFNSPFLAQSSTLLMVGWSYIEAIAESSCVAKIAVTSEKIAVSVLSHIGRSLVQIQYNTGRVLRHFLAVRLLQFSLKL